MINVSPLIQWSFVLYIALLLVIGIAASRRTANLSDYILGGRRLGPWASALSAGASDMSGWLLLGLPGFAYIAGLEAIWIAVGLLVGTWLNWFFVAKKIRATSIEVGDALTIPDYLEKRFQDNSHLLRIVSAFFILMFFLFYTSSGLVAGGKLFETVFGFPYQYAVIVGAAAIIAYTFVGGFLAVSWTDLLQGLLMLAALLIVPMMAIQSSGGWDVLSGVLEQQRPDFLNALTTGGITRSMLGHE